MPECEIPERAKVTGFSFLNTYDLLFTGTTLIAPENETLWNEYETKMKKYVVPQTWSFDKNGNLKSFEYLATDSPMHPPTQSFVAELYFELKKFGLDGNLGIRRIDNFIGNPSWETTPDGSRSNVVVFGSMPDSIKDENTVVVLWYFDDNGILRQGGSCIFCFVHYCGTCTH